MSDTLKLITEACEYGGVFNALPIIVHGLKFGSCHNTSNEPYPEGRGERHVGHATGGTSVRGMCQKSREFTCSVSRVAATAFDATATATVATLGAVVASKTASVAPTAPGKSAPTSADSALGGVGTAPQPEQPPRKLPWWRMTHNEQDALERKVLTILSVVCCLALAAACLIQPIKAVGRSLLVRPVVVVATPLLCPEYATMKSDEIEPLAKYLMWKDGIYEFPNGKAHYETPEEGDYGPDRRHNQNAPANMWCETLTELSYSSVSHRLAMMSVYREPLVATVWEWDNENNKVPLIW